MFDLKWLDDCFLVSGSRDTKMALWKLEDVYHPTVINFKALAVKRCKTAEKVRALAFNKRDVEIAALSLNGYIHLWKADTFKQVSLRLINSYRKTCNITSQIFRRGHKNYTTGWRTCVLDTKKSATCTLSVPALTRPYWTLAVFSKSKIKI